MDITWLERLVARRVQRGGQRGGVPALGDRPGPALWWVGKEAVLRGLKSAALETHRDFRSLFHKCISLLTRGPDQIDFLKMKI